MRRLLLSLIFLLPFALSPASAQAQQQPRMADTTAGPMPMMRMMQGMHGMHQQMVQSPMHRAVMTAFVLPALADTLGLSEEQTNQLEELRSELQAQRQEHQQQMAAHRQELMNLFEGDRQPDPTEVRTRLLEAAQLRAEGQVATYETARRMREVLTEEQQRRLDELTPQRIHQQMMRSMTMMEMMQMMRSMHGGRMGGGMMMQDMPMMH